MTATIIPFTFSNDDRRAWDLWDAARQAARKCRADDNSSQAEFICALAEYVLRCEVLFDRDGRR